MEHLITLLTLILLEIVLVLDNVIFISIVAALLPVQQQKKARRLGLILAMFMRLALLTIISLIMELRDDLFSIFSMGISGKDLILIAGGIFLLYKSATEIHYKVEVGEGDTSAKIKANTFAGAIGQILILDLVFSIDSIITAVGMANKLWIMYVAVVVSVGVMVFASAPISKFVNDHPAFKMLALSFLLLIGVSLIAEGLEFHILKSYIYFSMAFALLVNVFQMRMNRKKEPHVHTLRYYPVTRL